MYNFNMFLKILLQPMRNHKPSHQNYNSFTYFFLIMNTFFFWDIILLSSSLPGLNS